VQPARGQCSDINGLLPSYSLQPIPTLDLYHHGDRHHRSMDAEEGGLYIGRAYDAALASPIFQVDGDAFSGDANYAAEEGGWSAAAAPASDGAAAIWGVADIIKLSLAEHAPLLQLSVSSSGPSRMGWPRPSQQRLEEIAAEAAAHRRKRTAPAPAAGAPLPTRPATDETLASARAVACPAAAVVPKWRRPHALVIPETGSCSPTQPRSSRRKLVLEVGFWGRTGVKHRVGGVISHKSAGSCGDLLYTVRPVAWPLPITLHPLHGGSAPLLLSNSYLTLPSPTAPSETAALRPGPGPQPVGPRRAARAANAAELARGNTRPGWRAPLPGGDPRVCGWLRGASDVATRARRVCWRVPVAHGSVRCLQHPQRLALAGLAAAACIRAAARPQLQRARCGALAPLIGAPLGHRRHCGALASLFLRLISL
jgi:hypothetical protein